MDWHAAFTLPTPFAHACQAPWVLAPSTRTASFMRGTARFQGINPSPSRLPHELSKSPTTSFGLLGNTMSLNVLFSLVYACRWLGRFLPRRLPTNWPMGPRCRCCASACRCPRRSPSPVVFGRKPPPSAGAAAERFLNYLRGKFPAYARAWSSWMQSVWDPPPPRVWHPTSGGGVAGGV